jgi:hypothetical protein
VLHHIIREASLRPFLSQPPFLVHAHAARLYEKQNNNDDAHRLFLSPYVLAGTSVPTWHPRRDQILRTWHSVFFAEQVHAGRFC